MKQLIIDILTHFKSPLTWIGIGIASIGVVITTSEVGFTATAGIIIIVTGAIIANKMTDNTTNTNTGEHK